MNLKDAMKIDVQTFINMDEFAEYHSFGAINKERTIRMIVENDIETVSPLSYAEGVSSYRKILHVDVEELGYYPEREMKVSLDGVEYEVTDVEDARGILKVTIEANIS